MPDREKVLKALEHHKETAVCIGCPYAEDIDTPQGNCPVYDDAIALLREQEPVKPTWRRGLVFCGKCGRQFGRGFKYCPDCGRAVWWDA